MCNGETGFGHLWSIMPFASLSLSQLSWTFLGCRLVSVCHPCRVCRSAAVKFSPETVRGSCHGKCREISGEISLLLVPQENKARKRPELFTTNFTPLFTRRFAAANAQFHGVFHSADVCP